jgi:ketosteroid isomerase-like protein
VPDRVELVRESYRAFRDADREAIERLLSPDFAFYAPPDPGIDRDGYFERCWPGAGQRQRFHFVRLEEVSGDAVLVTYELTRQDGTRCRNTEVLTFRNREIVRQEVYWGWDLPAEGERSDGS